MRIKRESLMGAMAAQLLAMGKNAAFVATEVGVSERTVRNWCEAPEFTARVEQYRDAMAREFAARTADIELRRIEGRVAAAQMRHDELMGLIRARQEIYAGSDSVELRTGLYRQGKKEAQLDQALIEALREDERQVHRQTMDVEGAGQDGPRLRIVLD